MECKNGCISTIGNMVMLLVLGLVVDPTVFGKSLSNAQSLCGCVQILPRNYL